MRLISRVFLLLAAALLLFSGTLLPASAAPPIGGATDAGRIGAPPKEFTPPPRPNTPATRSALARTEVRKFTFDVQPYRYWYAWAYCPAGMVATGGGAYAEWDGGPELKATRALDAGAGWRVTVANYTNTVRSVTMQVICYSGLSNYNIRTATILAHPNAIAAGGAQCTSGQVIGGGAWADTDNTTLVRLQPLQAENRYWTALRNNDAVTRTLTVQSICADGLGYLTYDWSPATSVFPGGRLYISAGCPDGKTILSGGAIGTLIHADVLSNRWYATLRNDQPDFQTLYATILCGT
ncbi:hypothetical protein ACFTSF_13440 [Kribbella sp. NPDC056951]|uniref:hypothetical protein n=1 Tax=Kribbella sp. NPDC056951 TaxID=3345978 RepID=UPI003633E16B